jgi:hypothetical protein
MANTAITKAKNSPHPAITSPKPERRPYMTVNAKRLRNALILASLLLAPGNVRPTAGQKPATASRIAANCQTARPMILVRSSVDSKLYLVDVCSVADSASGEDFRTEAK